MRDETGKYTMNEAEATLVKALRSNTYLQCKNRLKGDVYVSDPDSGGQGTYLPGHCCLGVACDVVGGTAGWVHDRNYGSWSYGSEYKEGTMPEWLGDKFNWRMRDDGMLCFHGRDGIRPTLSGCNDAGMTFDQIADVIEFGLVEHNDDPPYLLYDFFANVDNKAVV